jgi:YesN/AraC family two-component response regulator
MIDILELKNLCQTLCVLYVEDDEELHASTLRYLKKLFKDVDDAYNGEDGLKRYISGEYDIVLTDIKMPKLDGLRMTEEIKKINPNQELVILSAQTEQGYFLDAIHLGVSDYILKPIDYEQMNAVLYKVSGRLHIFKENQEYHESLEKLVIEKTKLLTENYEQTLTAMVEMIEHRDSYTGGHSERVAHYCSRDEADRR